MNVTNEQMNIRTDKWKDENYARGINLLWVLIRIALALLRVPTTYFYGETEENYLLIII